MKGTKNYVNLVKTNSAHKKNNRKCMHYIYTRFHNFL